MPVIALTSAKGGCGKTTAALVLASAFAQRGMRIGLLESDAAGHLVHWKVICQRFGALPTGVAVGALNSDDPVGHVQAATAATDMLLIDLAGGLFPAATAIASRADLVLIPMMASVLDLSGAQLTCASLRAAGVPPRGPRLAGVIGRYDPVLDGRDFAALKVKLDALPLPLIDVRLGRRRLFKSLASLPTTLHTLDEEFRSESWSNAVANADAFADAVLRELAA